ncbi:MAG: cytochrome P450 [Pseudomonadota bacterium]
MNPITALRSVKSRILPGKNSFSENSKCPFASMQTKISEKTGIDISNFNDLAWQIQARQFAEKILQETLEKAIRPTTHVFSYAIVSVLKPLKIYAYKSQLSFVRRAIIEITTPIDFALIWLNIQNETMQLHEKIYGGNFIFGRGLMLTDYNSTAQDIVKPIYKTNDFMGVNIVSSTTDVFSTNSGILNQNQPIRKSTRHYVNDNIFTPRVQAYTYDQVLTESKSILRDWSDDKNMLSTFKIRGAVTRIFIQLLAQTKITKNDADDVTFDYMRRFVEFSLLQGYFPFLTGLLGTAQHIRKNVYIKLRNYKIDNMIIDMTMFAAMFSVGTLVIRCIENVNRYGINYAELSPQKKRNFIMESVRLYPTVTSIHRTLEKEETFTVANQKLHLQPGDQIAYPFICSNQDKDFFTKPNEFNIHRSEKEYEGILSWSKGPHDCPAKELSILVTQIMVDTIAQKHDLRAITILNPAF